jgi:hypothetical protein
MKFKLSFHFSIAKYSRLSKSVLCFSKKLLLLVTIFFIFGYSNTTTAQTHEERQEITKSYNTDKLKQLEQSFSKRFDENREKAYQFAQSKGIKTSYFAKDSSYVELQGILPNGTLLYYKTFNVDAAETTRTNHLNSGGSLGLALDGQGMVGYVWDGGHARESHQEYDGPGNTDRVTIADAVAEGGLHLNFHAAHVTGTVAASGFNPNAKGMAWQSQVMGYKWNNDLAEATSAAADGMLLSNHSYGYDSSQPPDYFFGGYISESRDWDNILYNAPYYLMVVAAGNDGNNDTFNGQPLDGNSAYDKLTGHTTSKNNLVVANAQDATIDATGDLISAVINSSSSEGPTDDYRIKPDITGNGTSLYSTLESSDTAYGNLTGTSMASPNVMGSLLLLQQHANNLYGSFLRSSTLKGLALHTADDIGSTGPDAIHGWGLLNSKRAAETMSDNSTNTIVEEIILNQGETFSIDVTSDGIEDLKASISWTDPAGVATTNLNDTSSALVNDLDISITQSTNTFYPWRLTGVDSNANDADNLVDNFERIDVPDASGTYTITVKHKGTLSNGSQNFSLIVSGLTNVQQFCSTPGRLSATDITDSTAEINWSPSFSNPTNGYDYFVTSTGVVPDQSTTPTGSTSVGVTSTILTGLSPQTNYDMYVRSDCSGTPSFSEWMHLSFTTTCVAVSLPYSEDFESGIDNCWFISDPSQIDINNNCGTNATNFLRIRGGTHSATTKPINANGEVSVEVSFDIRNGCTKASDPGEPLNVEYWDGSAWTIIESIESSDISQQVWEQKNYDIIFLSGLTSNFKLRFNRIGGSNDFDDLNIDNLNIISKGYIFTNGSWSPNHPITGSIPSTISDNITVIDGNTLLSGELIGNNLKLEAVSSLELMPSASPTSTVLNLSGNIVNEGSIVFKSDVNGTAQLDEFTGTISGSGDITIERFIPVATQDTRAFRFLTSTLDSDAPIYDNWQESGNSPAGYGTHITGSSTGADGFDPTETGNPSMFVFDNNYTDSGNAWYPIGNTNNTYLEAGKAYRLLIRGDRNYDMSSYPANSPNTDVRLRATGTLAVGAQTFSLNQVGGLYSLVGNAYQSIVDVNDIITNHSTNVNANFYYVWDPNMSERGAYVSVPLPGSTPVGSSEANQYIMPGQSFFVQTLSDGAADITFTEASKNVAATPAKQNQMH